MWLPIKVLNMSSKPNRVIQIGFSGFVIALIGIVLGFGGFYLNERWISLIGFPITVLGVIIGFLAVAYGWITFGRKAITESGQAAASLSEKVIGFFKKDGK